MESKTESRTPHVGRKIRRMREILGVKQDTVADELGISQQAVSKIEKSEQVDENTLEKIASTLGVSPGAIKNFSEDAIFNQLHNTLHDNSSLVNYQCSFNPIDKWAEAVEENKKLYEKLLKSEREKVTLLEKMLDGKK